MSKLITVFGATGQQGGSVVNGILQHPELSKTYKVRAITRDTSKPAAQALKSKGAEVFSADLNDKASVANAIKGSAAVYGVTNFWEKISKDVEVTQGKNIADACKQAGVEHLIWSSLPHISKVTQGRNQKVQHFDSKAEVEEYIRSIGVPATFFMPAMFMQSFADFWKPNEDSSVYTMAVPFPPEGGKLPLIDIVSDTGKYVTAALLKPQLALGMRIAAAADYYSPEQARAIYEKFTGRKAAIAQVPPEVFAGFLPPVMAEELTANFLLFARDGDGYYAGEPADAIQKAHALLAQAGVGKPVTLEDYCKSSLKV